MTVREARERLKVCGWRYKGSFLYGEAEPKAWFADGQFGTDSAVAGATMRVWGYPSRADALSDLVTRVEAMEATNCPEEESRG